MKKKSPIFVLAPIGLLCALTPSCFAQTWSASLIPEQSVMRDWFEGNPDNDYLGMGIGYIEPTANSVYFDDVGYNGVNIQLADGTGSDKVPYGATITGKLRVEWTPPSVNSTPPAVCVLKTSGYIWAFQCAGSANAVFHPQREISIQTGTNSKWQLPVVMSESNPDATWGVNQAFTTPDSGTPQEKHPLVSLDFHDAVLVNGVYRKEFDYKVLGTNYATSFGDQAMMGTQGYFKVVPDNRSLKLTRGGRHEYSEMQNGEWHTYGDSIYSAQNPTPIVAAKDIPLDIASQYLGNWTTKNLGLYYDVTSSWSATGFQAGFQNNETHCYGFTKYGTPVAYFDYFNDIYFYEGDPTGPETFTTTQTVKDNGDNTTTKAHYHLTLHDPVELLDEGETVTGIQILKPYTHGGSVLGWSGLRDASSATIELTDETSIETGLSLKATASVDTFREILGLSAEANYTSTHKFTTTLKTEVPKDIAAGQFKYLIAIHNFTRHHKRFYAFDQDGEIRRMVSTDAYGNPINPPVAMYHELIEDTAGQPDARWSDALPGPMDEEALPSGSVPAPNYDFPIPSGGSA